MKIEISIGELVDKVTILSIKMDRMKNPDKLHNVKHEYNLLYQIMLTTGIDKKNEIYNDLLSVNKKLWDIEDKIRRKEYLKEFDEEFIELARSVYIENDERARIKREINEKSGSELIEEKEYVDYK